MRFPLTPRTIFVALLIVAVAAALFLVARSFSFDAAGVRVELRAPQEMDTGSVTEIPIVVINDSTATLRNGTVTLDLPDGFTLNSSTDTTFDTFAPHTQITARFQITAMGEAGTEGNLVAQVQFQPRKISASFTRKAQATVRLRDLPLDLTFSFPSDATSGRPLTFFLRYDSKATSTIGPIGISLQVPDGFHITKAQPRMVTDVPGLWDLGMVDPTHQDEIAVTGTFDAGSPGGNFIAHIGFLDAGRRALATSREVSEYLNLRAGAVPIDIVYQDQENPAEEIVGPGDSVDMTLRYRNATPEPLDDLSVLLAFAHEAVVQDSVTSSERFTRAVSGEFSWTPDSVVALKNVEPSASGEITFHARLSATIPMKTFDDREQSITVRARTMSGGRIFGERTLVLKIKAKLAITVDVRYYNALGGNNYGPIPPRVGQETSYTATLTVAGGTNGISGVVARAVLGSSVTYQTVVSGDGTHIVYDPNTREVRWSIGDLIAGTGTLSPPKTVSFRIVLKPISQDVGSTPDLVSSVSATGTDTYVSQTLDASDSPVDTSLPDDRYLGAQDGVVRP